MDWLFVPAKVRPRPKADAYPIIDVLEFKISFNLYPTV
jgi:hypothetical protein